MFFMMFYDLFMIGLCFFMISYGCFDVLRFLWYVYDFLIVVLSFHVRIFFWFVFCFGTIFNGVLQWSCLPNKFLMVFHCISGWLLKEICKNQVAKFSLYIYINIYTFTLWKNTFFQIEKNKINTSMGTLKGNSQLLLNEKMSHVLDSTGYMPSWLFLILIILKNINNTLLHYLLILHYMKNLIG